MAELTDEEKIVVGVCVGVGGLVLIAIVVLLCYYCLCRVEKTPKKRRRHYYKERIIDNYRPPPYEPIPIPYPPPLPAPMPVFKVPPPRPVTVEYTDPYKESDFRYGKWDGVFRNDPIVIPIEPEIYTDGRYLQEQDTIYLKYNDNMGLQKYQGKYGYADGMMRYGDDRALVRANNFRYNDDQALLRAQNMQRRYNYAIEGESPPALRRARSFNNLQNVRTFTMTKRETPYVGEWTRGPSKGNNLSRFNSDAYKDGRDPYLWD